MSGFDLPFPSDISAEFDNRKSFIASKGIKWNYAK